MIIIVNNRAASIFFTPLCTIIPFVQNWGLSGSIEWKWKFTGGALQWKGTWWGSSVLDYTTYLMQRDNPQKEGSG